MGPWGVEEATNVHHRWGSNTLKSHQGGAQIASTVPGTTPLSGNASTLHENMVPQSHPWDSGLTVKLGPKGGDACGLSQDTLELCKAQTLFVFEI